MGAGQGEDQGRRQGALFGDAWEVANVTFDGEPRVWPRPA